MKAKIPTGNGNFEEFDLHPGTSIVFVGANGAGKTRLGVRLERDIGRTSREVHRIAAHRSLSFNDALEVTSYERAERMLRYGYAGPEGTVDYREGHRWGQKPATILLSDFDHLLRTLYAEQDDIAIEHLEKHRADPNRPPPLTKLLRLKEIWERLLPDRELLIRGASVKVFSPGTTGDYNASELSDGERVIFYLIGQALLVRPDAVLIVDEPELHIHKSILADLWDQIEGARKDLTFIYTTHDLEFATTRNAERKYAIIKYVYSKDAANEYWTIAKIKEIEDLPEQIVSRILGSRRGILFVEGKTESLDPIIYRRIYPKRTVIPISGHDQVIHSVASFRSHPELHRLRCYGLIDCDDHSVDEAQLHAENGIYVLPVSEVENLLLLPVVFYTIARSLDFSREEARTKTQAVSKMVLETARNDIERFSIDYARRRIDRAMKSIGLSAKDAAGLASEFERAVKSIDIQDSVNRARALLDYQIKACDLYGVLRLYDNKGLLADAAKHLNHSKKGLEEYIGRVLANRSGRLLRSILRRILPKVPNE